MIANKLNPGSEKAIEKGCICPVLDNYHGKGFEGKFWMVENCPLHGNIRNKDKSEEEKLWKLLRRRKIKRTKAVEVSVDGLIKCRDLLKQIEDILEV